MDTLRRRIVHAYRDLSPFILTMQLPASVADTNSASNDMVVNLNNCSRHLFIDCNILLFMFGSVVTIIISIRDIKIVES